MLLYKRTCLCQVLAYKRVMRICWCNACIIIDYAYSSCVINDAVMRRTGYISVHMSLCQFSRQEENGGYQHKATSCLDRCLMAKYLDYITYSINNKHMSITIATRAWCVNSYARDSLSIHSPVFTDILCCL